jgi:cyclophilin family peptidyl-prolyl cis-trans isomerase
LLAIPTSAPVANEFNLSNVRGTLAMALSGSDVNSATNQFFFNTADNSSVIDPQRDTVIGQVVQIQQTISGTPTCGGPTGLAVMDAINAVPTYDYSAYYGSGFSQLPLVNYTPGNIMQPSNFVTVNSITQGTPTPAVAGAEAH